MPIVLELSADRGVELESGVDGAARVVAWRGEGPAATEDDPARRPRWIEDAGDGIPAIRFAAAERLVVPDAAELHPADRDFAVFVVARTRAVTSAQRIAHHGNTTSRDRGWSIFTEPSRAGLAVRFRSTGRGAGAQSHGYRNATELGATAVYELRIARRLGVFGRTRVRARLGDARMTDGGGGTDERRVDGGVVPEQDLILGGGSGPLDLFAVVVVTDADDAQLRAIRRDLDERFPPTRPAAISDLRADQTLYRWGREAVSVRIPAIARCEDGTLLAFAELRSRVSDAGYIKLGVRRSTDDGRTWGPVIVVKDDGRNCSRNPVPIVDRRTGRVVLVSCHDRHTDDEHRINAGTAKFTRVFVQHSDDSGLTWSEPREISDSVRKQGWRWYATGPGGVEQLAGGRMLVPCNHTHPRQKGGSRSHTIYSDDGGETWQLGGQIDAPGTNEGQLAQRPDGAVLLYMRNQPHGRKQLAVSTDDGATFGPARRVPELVGTACQGDILAVGDVLLATSHQHFRRRAELAVNLSEDGGATWPAYTVVSPTSAAYSDMVLLRNGRIGMLSERDDARIVFTTFRLPERLRGR